MFSLLTRHANNLFSIPKLIYYPFYFHILNSINTQTLSILFIESNKIKFEPTETILKWFFIIEYKKEEWITISM
tara:strand:+ start:451 stop:672 length:222 start_codon:yes stop_codon:yes gene_type:complete